jgi:hypothetical protein
VGDTVCTSQSRHKGARKVRASDLVSLMLSCTDLYTALRARWMPQMRCSSEAHFCLPCAWQAPFRTNPSDLRVGKCNTVPLQVFAIPLLSLNIQTPGLFGSSFSPMYGAPCQVHGPINLQRALFKRVECVKQELWYGIVVRFSALFQLYRPKTPLI